MGDFDPEKVSAGTGVGGESGSGEDTGRDRLLDAAEHLFAQKGFAGTSVRDITTAAACNVAAVNYHFGGKEGLYLAVYRSCLKRIYQYRKKSIDAVFAGRGDDVTIEDLLWGFGRSFLESFINEPRNLNIVKIIMRERLDPLLDDTIFRDEFFVPIKTMMFEAIKRVCPELDEYHITLCSMSIVGQLMHATQSIAEHLKVQDWGVRVPDKEELLEHIITFSLGGIRATIEKNAGKDDKGINL